MVIQALQHAPAAPVAAPAVVRGRFRDGWIFSPTLDLLAFLGPLALGGAILASLAKAGRLEYGPSPWLYAFLTFGVDVAHGNATFYRTYLDAEEFARRRRFIALPFVLYFVMFFLGILGDTLFFRVLAYMAAIHFVRQQYGWIAYSNRKAGGVSPLDYRLDTLAIYNVTLFPLIWWHSHPRPEGWFVPNDLLTILPPWMGEAAAVLYVCINVVYLGRQAFLFMSGQPVNRAKLLIWLSTLVVWYVSIIKLNSLTGFAVLQILAHGVPYLMLVWVYGSARWKGRGGFPAFLFHGWGILLYYFILVDVAWCEDAFRDRLVLHHFSNLFPLPAVTLSRVALGLIAPLLVMRPMMHYVLDAIIWRARSGNPHLVERLKLRASAESTLSTGSVETQATGQGVLTSR